VTPKEAQKALKCADLMAVALDWKHSPREVRLAYQSLVRLCVKYGAK
jgi:hypothetical protein